MRREHIALVARARHDSDARREVGRRYLAGLDGFPRHEQLALEYLTHPSVQESADAAHIICQHLDLDRIIEVGHEATLRRAADAGAAEAQFKLAAWSALVGPDAQTSLRWLRKAAGQGHAAAAAVERSLQSSSRGSLEERLLAALRRHWPARFDTLALTAAGRMQDHRDPRRIAACIRIAMSDAQGSLLPVARMLASSIRAAIDGRAGFPCLPADRVEACLETLLEEADPEAAYWLGCGYCGIAVPPIGADRLVAAANLRRGAALLMRAADAGQTQAWMHLYRVHSNHRCSVANPQLARYFLEKAAAGGIAEAQRRLGALLLRSSASLRDSELAAHWLHAAAQAGDAPALQLLHTLVLSVQGGDADAERALAVVRTADPWLAARLQLSRDFGLTKLEALCVDPLEGRRPWGLVVGRNPFVVSPKLAAPRAVPATTSRALDTLQRTVLLFDAARRDGGVVEGDYRQRSARQRRLFARHGIGEALFFADGSTKTLEAMRRGPKWILRARRVFEQAIAANPETCFQPAAAG